MTTVHSVVTTASVHRAHATPEHTQHNHTYIHTYIHTYVHVCVHMFVRYVLLSVHSLTMFKHARTFRMDVHTRSWLAGSCLLLDLARVA